MSVLHPKTFLNAIIAGAKDPFIVQFSPIKHRIPLHFQFSLIYLCCGFHSTYHSKAALQNIVPKATSAVEKL